MSSTGVRACSWTLQITDPSREVVAEEQVSLELRQVFGGVVLFTVTIQSCHPLHLLSCLLFLHCKAGQFSFYPAHQTTQITPLSQPWP